MGDTCIRTPPHSTAYIDGQLRGAVFMHREVLLSYFFVPLCIFTGTVRARYSRQDVRPPPDAWKRYAESPKYLGGRELRPYQLEGVNWLVFSWYQVGHSR